MTRTRVSMVDAQVDLHDVLDALDDDDILEMLDNLSQEKFDKLLRKRSKAPEPDPLQKYVDEAIDLIRTGRADDALLILERTAHPKWQALTDFERAMREAAAA